MTLTVVYAILFYIAAALFTIGVARKIVIYSKTPQPLKIPTTPAPITKAGVVWRMLKEVTVFESLFKSNKWIWIFGWMFHLGLFLVLARHLRFFLEPVPAVITLIQPFGKYAAFAMIAGLIGLWARRFFVDRVRYISSMSDHLMLLLLITIGISGALMTFGGVTLNTDVTSVKAFIMGLIFFDLQPLPDSTFLLIHLALVALLMIVFPISKLLHAPGVFFSPTRNQTDDVREHRHVAGWSAK
ncbi:MAG: respiratory nitrate reductase subunit gamma [Gammaproteobacteria bacterium]|nr:respiratory nitrate reductase subunit gamma [Gammaproteobacteria bacterium]